MNRARLIAQLTAHEGLRLFPYRDTIDKLTIGVGRNLDDAGISVDEAHYLLLNDIDRVEQNVSRVLLCYSSLDDVRQRFLLEVAFIVGVAGLMKFKRMIAAIETHAFDLATTEFLDSVLARQIGEGRRRTLTVMLREGTE